MNAKTILFAACASAGVAVFAQGAAGARAAYQQQQAVQEVQRLSQQFDVLNENQDQLAARLAKLEGGGDSSLADLRAEIGALKAQLAELRREQERMRGEIIAELARKIATMPRPVAAAPAPAPAPAPVNRAARQAPPPKPRAPEFSGDYYEHVVEGGQTLSEIARGYGTTINRILQANPGLKPQNIRVGQKLKVPADDKKK